MPRYPTYNKHDPVEIKRRLLNDVQKPLLGIMPGTGRPLNSQIIDQFINRVKLGDIPESLIGDVNHLALLTSRAAKFSRIPGAQTAIATNLAEPGGKPLIYSVDRASNEAIDLITKLKIALLRRRLLMGG